jgi:hypothetical protein
MPDLSFSQNASSAVAITFDIDWAPVAAITLCADICAEAGVKATFFVTHATPALERLRAQPDLFEIGIHPNFLTGSTHGDAPEAVLEHCLAIAPESASMRTHSLVQSTRLLELVANRYTQIEYDVSLLMPFHRNLQPTWMYCGEPARRIVRLPYYWEDDLAFAWPEWHWDRSADAAPLGMRIFNFHPIHVALNAENRERYRRFKADLGDVRLSDASGSRLEASAKRGSGTRSFLEGLVRSVPAERFATISELGASTGRESGNGAAGDVF